MRHPNVEEFKELLRKKGLESIVREYVFEGEPYAFYEAPSAYELLRRHLNEATGTREEDITVVGSGKIGFSLSPDTFPRQFSEESDIDVVVVNEELFDRLWVALLKWHYPRREHQPLPRDDRDWFKSRRNDIYWGYFLKRDVRSQYRRVSTTRPLQMWYEFSTKWFNAFKSLARHKEFASREVSGRLYRTWDHALLYHADGLRRIRDSL